MTSIRKAVAVLFVSLVAACSQQEVPIGHQLRLFAVDQPDVIWVSQNDVRSAIRFTDASSGHPMLQVQLRPDAAQRMLTLTNANVGKKVRFTWDGTAVADLSVVSTFGGNFQLPAPPI